MFSIWSSCWSERIIILSLTSSNRYFRKSAMTMSTKSPSQSRLSCQSCQKGFPYNKRLVDHVKKKEECQQFYTENQLDMPVPSGVKRKNQHDMPVIEKPPSVKRKRTSDTDQSEPSITLTDQSEPSIEQSGSMELVKCLKSDFLCHDTNMKWQI